MENPIPHQSFTIKQLSNKRASLTDKISGSKGEEYSYSGSPSLSGNRFPQTVLQTRLLQPF